ncbi:UDP-2,3-diacylglucosamine diphosphatase [Thiopseudomonas denitrificans]|uniref:UDP-2,3-diacylglucosamine hydrolase n=1 Tax=Thiopseudomonas denitrificans TaxID=1501432 RepID=A0A4R6U0W2_9GAMM|nr:UDP-2,3-diacylglucosamine diphosphatase [Thiopseudomonas denitrificans]TDQ39930.1 UDP-2,3-diacylglucosamine hydrolase [Thiopseudomonas denitrificans]
MILLISDLHLHEQRPDIARAFFRFLQETAPQADALYILGDFFEVWIGDDAISPFQQQVATALKQLADSGTRIYLMHGNRDFLIGNAFCLQAGCQLLKDPALLQHNGESILLMHGDSLCTDDHDYQRMKRILRNPLSLFILRHLPLKTRRKLAGDLRAKSRSQTRMKAAEITDVNAAAVEQAMQRHGVRTLIHGHTHRPATHNLPTGTRIVLGDWDSHGWYLQLDETGIEQHSFAI